MLKSGMKIVELWKLELKALWYVKVLLETDAALAKLLKSSPWPPHEHRIGFRRGVGGHLHASFQITLSLRRKTLDGRPGATEGS